jgi:uncharacterized repeat protein (TIGR03803 family)
MLATWLRASLVVPIMLFVSSLAFGAETVLHNFDPYTTGGINPAGGLFLDSAGNFYGTGLDGTLFEFSPNGSGSWNYKMLCKCSATYGYGSLVMDKSGNLYGSTFWGQIYRYSPGGSSGWVATRLHAFSGPSGSGPSPLTIDANGNLYGVYGAGGAHGKGFIFKLAQQSTGAWALTHLHDFSGADGAAYAEDNAYTLLGGLIMDHFGHLFGTANQGGMSTKCASGCGTVFEMVNNSGKWTYKVLHSFNRSDGMNPDAPLLLDGAGNLYGTTTSGGTRGAGVVFRIAANTSNTTVLYNFTNMNGDGAYPNSALVIDRAGNIFGTTEAGGGSSICTVENDNGCGTLFRLTPSGGAYQKSTLVRFSGKQNGGFPGGVSIGLDRNLYGIAEVGGSTNKGLFFEIPQ